MAVSGVAGYVLLIGLTLAIPSISQVLSAKDASGNPIPAAIAVMQLSLGAKAGNAMAALTSMAMWFCGLSSITSVSRTLYSLARDHGTPCSEWVRKVDPKHGTPGPAIWVSTIIALLAMAWTGAIPVVTSFSTVAYYVAYLIPIVLAVRRDDWRKEAVWNLGRYSKFVHWVAIGYTVVVCFVLVMPPNELAGRTLLALLCFLAVLYRVEARKKYKGPEWIGHHS